MKLILDNDTNDKATIDGPVIKSVAKWGKLLIILGLGNFIYFFVYSILGLLKSSGTSVDEPFVMKIYPFFSIAIGLSHLPSMIFFLRFYLCLNSNDEKRLSSSFTILKTGIAWGIFAVILEFTLNFFYAHFAKYFF